MAKEKKTEVWRQNEAFECFERVRPILEEFFDDWIITARRAGCGTKIILGDYDRKKTDMAQLMADAKDWKKKPLEDS